MQNFEHSLISGQRDEFIDFLKGVSIICVILTHSLPHSTMKHLAFGIWGSMAVPIFLILQAYHSFRKDLQSKTSGLSPLPYCHHWNIRKLYKRILRPFLVTTFSIASILILAGNSSTDILRSCLINGGIGPGCYYIWIYLQFWLLLPICLHFARKWGGWLLVMLIVISQASEWICMLTDVPEPLYRVLCLRYLFLIYFGYAWVFNGMVKTLSLRNLLLALASLALLLELYYTDETLNPWLHDSNWRIFHWIVYAWPGLFLPWIMFKVYNIMLPSARNLINRLGKSSYEIFLTQMAVFSLYPYLPAISENSIVNHLAFVILSAVLSILPVAVWRKVKTHTLSHLSRT